MKPCYLLAATVATLAVGCVTDPELTFSPVTATAEDVAVAAVQPDGGATVHDLQRPGSPIADGTHVVLDDAALRVTAQAGRSLWVQEADATGVCDDDSAARVEFRAIRVELGAGDHLYRPGEQVRIAGDVLTIGGHRQLAHAEVTSLGMAAPYRAHCERDATLLADPALAGVLVRTAGRAMGELPPVGTAAWALRSCFAHDVVVRVEAPMQTGGATAGTWRWVTGVVQPADAHADVVVQPRTHDDVIEGGSDVCL